MRDETRRFCCVTIGGVNWAQRGPCSRNITYPFIHQLPERSRNNDMQIKHRNMQNVFSKPYETSYRPGGGETICPPAMAVRLAAGPQSARGQAAGSQRAYSLGQLRYGRDGRIAVSLKRPGVAGLKLGLDCAKL